MEIQISFLDNDFKVTKLQITMMAGGLVLTVASFIMAIAPNWETLTLGRALDGIAIGI